jgi:hypothetical protein
MLGNAMLTIVASTNATAAPSEAIASTLRGDGARRRVPGACSTAGDRSPTAVGMVVAETLLDTEAPR